MLLEKCCVDEEGIPQDRCLCARFIEVRMDMQLIRDRNSGVTVTITGRKTATITSRIRLTVVIGEIGR